MTRRRILGRARVTHHVVKRVQQAHQVAGLGANLGRLLEFVGQLDRAAGFPCRALGTVGVDVLRLDVLALIGHIAGDAGCHAYQQAGAKG